MRYEFNVPGKPVGKQRPRAFSVGGHARLYPAKGTVAYEGKVALAFREAYPDAVPGIGPFSVAIRVCVGLGKRDYTPKGALSKGGKAKTGGKLLPTKKPDVDNVAKSVLDALNGVAWLDDSQVVRLEISKSYSAAGDCVSVSAEEVSDA